MKTLTLVLLAAVTLLAAGTAQTFTGTITDSMCLANHAMMHVRRVRLSAGTGAFTCHRQIAPYRYSCA